MGGKHDSSGVFAVAGHYLDKHGAKRLLRLILVPYVFSVAALSLVGTWWQLGVCFFVLRILGPGCLMLTATTVIGSWFTDYKGFAVATFNIALSSDLILPEALKVLIDEYGWRPTTRLNSLAIGCACTMVYLALPANVIDGRQQISAAAAKERARVDAAVATRIGAVEANGTVEDGVKLKVLKGCASVGNKAESDAAKVGSMPEPTQEPAEECFGEDNLDLGRQLDGRAGNIGEGDYSEEASKALYKSVLRSRFFWTIVVGFATTAIFWGGVNLHMVNICQEHGLTRSDAANAFALTGIGSMLATAVSAIAMDYMKSKHWVLALSLGLVIAAQVVMINMKHGMDAILFGTLYGVVSGMQATVFTRLLSDAYDVSILGRVNGFLGGACICGTGAGPILFSLSQSLFQTYSAILGILSVLSGVAALGLMTLKSPTRQDVDREQYSAFVVPTEDPDDS